MDYVAELYKQFFRALVKDIARQYPDDSEDTLKLEMKYIQERLKDNGLDSLFESVLNRDTFYQFLDHHQEENITEYSRSIPYRGGVDFSSIRENGKATKDIVWILKRTFAKYQRGGNELVDRVDDRSSYEQFERLLEEIGFSDREKQFFYYTDKDSPSKEWEDNKYFRFNGLVDNGDIIYSQKDQDNNSLFLNALNKSNLQEMHDKLKALLKGCYKKKESKSIQKMDVQKAIEVTEYLSDLLPVIDENSKLKSEEQLQEERIAVRYAVLKKLLMNGKYNNGKSGYEYLKNILVKHYEDHILGKMLLGIVCNQEEFNEDQILVMTEGYFDSLGQHLEDFKHTVEKYQKVCNKLQSNSYPIQLYRDMWEKVWNDSVENR